jgi:hypothetical protein
MVPWCRCGSILKDTRHLEGFVLDQAVPPQVLIIPNKCMVMCNMTNNYSWFNVAWSCLRKMWHVIAIMTSQICCMFVTENLFTSSILGKPWLYQFNFVSLHQEAMTGCSFTFSNSPSQSVYVIWAATTTELQMTTCHCHGRRAKTSDRDFVWIQEMLGCNIVNGLYWWNKLVKHINPIQEINKIR